MKKIFFSLVFGLLSSTLSAQHEVDKWYFGANAGIDFTSGTAVVLSDGAMNASEGCSAISDSTGNLLFYTDGITVWNKIHQPMSNGDSLAGGISTQSALIVPQPGSASLYYVFTNDAVSGTNGFCYSIVDMSLDSGRGDVTVKNVFIRGNVTEKLTGVANNQSNGYWISVHEFGTDSFCTYGLTSVGLDTIPVISKTGIRHGVQQMGNAYGQMKFSSCGNRIAAAIGYTDTVQIFDFDNATGIISNPITIPMPDHVFGIEFSPDGQKIYISTYAPATLYQFDLSSGVEATIVLTHVALSISPDIYSLQLAIDGKIYVVKSFSSWLGAITDPDVAGPSCHYVDTALNVDPLFIGHSAALGLPGFVQSFFRTKSSCLGNGIDEIKSYQSSIYPNPSSSEFNIQILSDAEVAIWTINGKLLERLNLNNQMFTFGKDLLPGIYFVRIKSSGEEKTIKAIKL